MNIYELLRKIVEARSWTDQDRTDALALLNDMERLNVLGTTAGSLREASHECERGGVWFPQSMQCKVCGKGLDAQPHSCIPVEVTPSVTGWGRAKTEIRCKICNKEMLT